MNDMREELIQLLDNIDNHSIGVLGNEHIADLIIAAGWFKPRFQVGQEVYALVMEGKWCEHCKHYTKDLIVMAESYFNNEKLKIRDVNIFIDEDSMFATYNILNGYTTDCGGDGILWNVPEHMIYTTEAEARAAMEGK